MMIHEIQLFLDFIFGKHFYIRNLLMKKMLSRFP